MENQIPELEKWSLVSLPPSGMDPENTPPELWQPHLAGEVYGHPSIPDGTVITTSRVINYDAKNDLIVCSSRRYRLGHVSLEYEEQFPNAKDRIVAAMQHGKLS